MIENVKITGTMLGYEDYGLLTCRLDFKGDGDVFGCISGLLDTFDKASGKHVPNALGLQAIAALLYTLEVDTWEKLPGTYVRIEGIGSRVLKIGHWSKDKWFSFEEHFAPLRAAKEKEEAVLGR